MSNVNIPADVEAHLANMTGDDWDTFVAKVRPPDHAEAFRDTASQWISGDRLDAVCKIITPSLYVDDAGNIDAAKVEHHLRKLFDDLPAPASPRWQSFGQHSPAPPMPGPGDRGKAEAQKRFHGAKQPQRVNAEAQKRFGKNGAQ